MKRKSILFILILSLIAPCMLLLSGCGETAKTSQTSNLRIADVYQTSYGDVFIEFENADDYFDTTGNNESYYVECPIEISCDNGTTWDDYRMVDYDTQNTGLVLSYDETSEGFVMLPFNSPSYSVGYTAIIIARLKETDTMYASNSTEPYTYTLKSVLTRGQSAWDRFGSYTDAALTGDLVKETNTVVDEIMYVWDDRFQYYYNGEIIAKEYVLYRNDNTIKIGSLTVVGDTFTITEITNYEDYEYMFVKTTDQERDNLITAYDNNNSSEGWNAFTSPSMIFDDNDKYVDNSSETPVYYLKVLVRIKETNTTCASICYSTYFMIGK